MTKKFENETKALKREELPDYMQRSPGAYLYDKPSQFLFQWSRALQATVSQAATYKFTGAFHDQDCGIYKCEGGCKIPGVNDLVLSDSSCYFDFGHHAEGKAKEERDEKVRQCAELITKIVVEWDPMDPLESMFKSAAEWLEMPLEEYKAGTEKSRCGGVFGGNSLSSFFSWNPFSEPLIIREYQRWCLVNYGNMTNEEVDQQYADEDLGKKLLADMQKKCKEAEGNGYLSPMCCSPRRSDKGLGFWINTGRSTQIDGWKTEEEIQDFLKSDGVLKDTMRH